MPSRRPTIRTRNISAKSDLKNFSINMGLSLVGIGAMLRSEDGYAKIESLVPGGPAQTSGKIKVGDRITAVAQGATEFNDVRDMRLDKVVEHDPREKGHQGAAAHDSRERGRSLPAQNDRAGAR